MVQVTGLITRRDVLKMAATVAVAARPALSTPQTSRPKSVVVVGGGIGGLSCGYELMKLGHDVVVLEATGRAGGHVRTVRDPLADGLYADGGAEHFTQPGYERFWGYVKEFNLEYCRCLQRDDVRRFILGKWYTEEMLRDPQVLSGFGFNQREVRYLAEHDWSELAMLYFRPYIDAFEDEYQPFQAGLNDLDATSLRALLERDGASQAALGFAGSSSSALHEIWHAAILKLRGVPLYPPKVFRLKGGNQVMTDRLAEKLGSRLWLGCPVERIEQGESGVTVYYQEFGRPKRMEADYVVNCVNLSMLQKISVTPGWSESKRYAIENLAYYSNTRVVIQSRTRFWEKDKLSPNMILAHPSLWSVWQMAAEVETDRAVLEGAGPGVVQAEDALAAFRERYPGSRDDIEQVYVVQWPLDSWSALCETVECQPGELSKIWPHIIEPAGRIHFAGAYADNLNWGMEAATRSAKRVADAIHAL